MSESARVSQSALTTINTRSKRWNREYLPGYAGFVPTKQSLFGKTSGAINREISLTGGLP
jgi:hypothetical protein